MTKKDYYKILKVSRTATKQEIKKAYKKLVLQYNLDKTAEKEFNELDEAYSVLGRSDMRQKYDEIGYLNFSLEKVVREAVRKARNVSSSFRIGEPSTLAYEYGWPLNI